MKYEMKYGEGTVSFETPPRWSLRTIDHSHPEPRPFQERLSEALARPIGLAPLAEWLTYDDICVIVSDITRYTGAERFLPSLYAEYLKGKKVDAGQGSWNGEAFVVRFCGQSTHAFRVDAPAFLAGDIGPLLCRIAAYSCSAECPGYPHALFRAHRDIRIAEPERAAVRRRLLASLAERGMSREQMVMLMQDFHDVLEMRPSF